MPDHPGAIALAPPSCSPPQDGAGPEDVEAIVQAVTDAVMAAVAGQTR
jgi:hypothetical protein